MRVLHFVLSDANPRASNGVDRAVYEIAVASATAGAEVTVFGLTSLPPIEIPGCTMLTFAPHESLFRLPHNLLQAVLDWQPDIIQTHSVYTPALTAMQRWAFQHDIPYVCTTQGALSPINERHGSFKKQIYKRLYQLPDMNRALFIHTSTKFEQLTDYGVRVPIVYAPNSIDYDTIPSELNRNYLLEHFPELHGKKIWLYLGRLGIFQKGLDILLQAYARARPATSKLVLIGPTKTAWHDTEEEIRQMAQALDIQDELLMPGAMFEPDKFHAFASADVLVYPSRWEATPLAVIEAATCGLTGILSKAASLDRMLTDADAAIEVELDPEKWANAIRTMDQKSKAELLEMGSRAARIVRENFRWDKTAAILLDAYEVQLSHARHHRAAPLPRLAF